MPDDCPVNDESRRTLRNLARRAEWRGQPGAAGAALDARTLRELGREIELVLGQVPESDPDHASWAHRASERLAAYSQRAQPDWTPEQIAELTRLRDDALTALAPGPGEAEAEAAAADSAATRRLRSNGTRPTIPGLGALTGRRRTVIALAVVCCLVLIALVLTLPHLLGGNSSQTPTASSTTTTPVTPTTTQPTYTPTAADSDTATTTPSSSAGTTTASPSTPAATTTSSASTSHATAIQITPDVLDGNPPEVIVSGTVTTSGTGDVPVYVTITGSSGQPQVTETDESGQTSYDLTQTINLSQWCGESSVRLTVSSGTVSKSATIPISGC